MALTVGTGPFGRKAAGVFNFERSGPAHVVYWEPVPWRVRAELAGVTVADSRRVMLLHETGLMPVYYFPHDDLRTDLLAASEQTSVCPFKGTASYWNLNLEGRTVENAAWGYRSVEAHAPPGLDQYTALFWSRMDRWFEEDRETFVHARDPYHRVDLMPTSREVRISVEGVEVAHSSRAIALFESSLPPRYYLPREDVRLDRLQSSPTVTTCPYKGHTTEYWSFAGPKAQHDDIAWSYGEPFAEVGGIAGYICFYDEQVDVDLDGERQTRPVTKFTHV